jgi:starch synthase
MTPRPRSGQGPKKAALKQAPVRKVAAKKPAAPKAAARKAPAPPVAAHKPAPKKRSQLRILMVASEAVPFSKTGGLADVASSLSRALGSLDHSVTLITPRYRSSGDGEPRGSVRAFVGGNWFDATLLARPFDDAQGKPLDNVTALLVDCPPLYDRAGLYFENGRDYPDNAARFAFLSIAALEWASSQSAPPSVIHIHDWQTGLTPIYARRYFAAAPVPFVLTIHNLAYQGIFDKAWVPRLGLGWEDFTMNGFEFYDQISFLKAGINRSDALTTVSPTYAEEIQRPEYGYSLDGAIRGRRDRLTGILNGIDTHEWNPATDPHLPAHYTADDLEGKATVKRALLERFGLAADDAAMRRPLVGLVTRLVDQKGMDLVEAAARELTGLDASFVMVGSGDARFEGLWRALASAFPDRIGAFIGFDEQRAHLVEGGADMFLMPSRFEPCGLNQMYSMRYGTVPVVRAVGGLVDTVRPYQPNSAHGTGFLFSSYHPAAMTQALREALQVYAEPRAWRRLKVNGMKKDFSWERSAADYVKVYKGVMGIRRHTTPSVLSSI